MTFTEETIKKAWTRSCGKCEFELKCCNHGTRCNKQLVFGNRGKDGEPGAWEAHRRTAVKSGGGDELSNCQILCLDCHEKTATYGEHKS